MPASALNCAWSPSTGNWGTAGSWSCASVPGAADDATIGVTKTVTINTPQSVLNLNNAGTVNIDAFLLTLTGGGSTINTGTINVGAGAIPNNAALQVGGSHNINNAGGVINVSADSVINQFGSTISGGTINTTGTGKVVAFNSVANFLSGVTLNGMLDLATGTGIERVNGGLTLGGPGAINIATSSILSLEGTQTIGGTGTINFGSSAGTIQLNGAGTTTLGAGITIQGENGTIGGGQSFVGGANTLVNNGIISANVAGGQINLLDTAGGGITNNNVLRASNGGTLNLQGVALTQGSSGQIQAQNGSTVIQNGSSITGGTISTGVTGVFTATNNGNNFLSGVTLTGKIDLATAVGIERVNGGLTLSGGAINLASGSIMSLEGSQTISGTGTVNFGGTASTVQLNGAGTTTLAAGVTIRGQNGTIGGGLSFDVCRNGAIVDQRIRA
ncbi:MAG TPA: hypothetical protein VK663_09320, partial [Burkholderiales bacterium]|nr:hypothetical protein [Burkholderiales bacterium]